MPKIHCDSYTNGHITSATPFTYRRPRCLFKHLAEGYERLVLCPRRLARLTGQAILSGSLISGGILVGLNPIGAFLAFTGFCLAFPLDEVESDEEYRQLVIAHFSERGKEPPRWTRRVK